MAASTDPRASADSCSAKTERYAALLEEARSLRGVSLWQDAWRRLRRNWVAMASLVLLVLISVLALLTPLIPLQSPLDKDLRNRLLLPPLPLTTVQLGARSDLAFADGSLKAELERYSAEIKSLEARVASPSGVARAAIERDIRQKRATSDPLLKLWNNPGPITRRMLAVRVSLFGDWCLPSLFGTDALGRDVLSRVFWGARVSLMVGIVATLVSLSIGVTYGATAGFLGG